MDTLPSEIKLKIFNLLSIHDSIKCRQVCKDWLVIIDCLRYTSLNFLVAIHHEQSEEIFFEKDIDLLILNFEKFFKSVTIDPKFGRIKVMNAAVCLTKVKNLDVFINHFHELEELNLLSYPRKLVVNLNFLKKFEFLYPSKEIKLETPSLTHLMTRKLSNFEICYPEQIKCIGVNNTLNLTKFTNLEILIIIDCFVEKSYISQLSSDFLNRLPHLKRVYVGWNPFIKRLDQIPINENSKLQVYYYGVRISSDLFGNFDWTYIKNSKESDEYDRKNLIGKNGEWTSFVARNYLNSIDDNPYDFNLDCNRLLDEFDQNIPNEFWKKFTKFHTIRIRNLDDEKKILKFLVSTKPSRLFIKNKTLSRSFLEQLIKFSFINCLIIRIYEWPAFLDDFNFDFENEKIFFDFYIHCSLKSLRPVFKLFEKMGSIYFQLSIIYDEFRLFLYYTSSDIRVFSIADTLNGKRICSYFAVESWDFCFYLDRQVPSIVELEDKLRLFSIVKKYKAQKKWKKILKYFAGFPMKIFQFWNSFFNFF